VALRQMMGRTRVMIMVRILVGVALPVGGAASVPRVVAGRGVLRMAQRRMVLLLRWAMPTKRVPIRVVGPLMRLAPVVVVGVWSPERAPAGGLLARRKP
jgi:hypothetical protein